MPMLNKGHEGGTAESVRQLRLAGLALVAVGTIAIVIPAFASLAAETLVAVLLSLSGCAGIALGLSLTKSPARGWMISLSCVLLVAGGLMIIFPFAGLRALSLVLVSMLLLEGSLSLIIAMRLSDAIPGAGWVGASGAASLLLAGLILWGWPRTALWALGLLLGVNFLTTGIALLLVAWSFQDGRTR